MPELTREEKLKIFSQLSPQLQEVLFSDATADTIDEIGKKYGLNDNQISLLAGIIGDVILRIVPITSLAQEINSKITSDAQVAMNLAQELNTELLAPVMTAPAPSISTSPNPSFVRRGETTPAQPPLAPPYQGGEKGEVISPSPRIDTYREPTFSAPEVVDLRKAPTPVPPLPISSPTPSEQRNRGSSISQPRQGGGEIGTITVAPAPAPTPAPAPIMPTPSAPKPLTSPLTFTRPIEPVAPKPVPPTPTPPKPTPTIPLIEAEPHKIPSPVEKPIIPIPKPIDPYKEPVEAQIPQPIPAPSQSAPRLEPKPQYIMRSSGAPPIDSPHDILDLRRDKGEF